MTATTDNGRTLGYQYDVAGNRTRITWPDAYHADYAYDVLGRILNITENGAGLLASYGYDTSGRRTSVTLGNEAITSYTYEVDDALNSLSHNMTGSANDVDWTYDYNTVGQLTRKVITQTNSAYEWLPVNNRNDAYIANGLNQYASVAGTVLVYDGNGNLTSDGIWSYGFDSENRLLSAAKSGTSASYRYDPVGRRSAKVVNGLTTEFLNDGVEEIADYNGVGTLLRRYVHGPGVDEYLVMYTGTGTTSKSYFHANHQGSIVAMSDGAGNVTEQHSYDSYGNSDELTGNPFRYTGRRLDAETGLYYYRARYYSPAIGRFLQTDPIGYGDGLNWYAYVQNDPINGTDPSGEACFCGLKSDDRIVDAVNSMSPKEKLQVAVATGVALTAGVGIVAAPSIIASAGSLSPVMQNTILASGVTAATSIAQGDSLGQTAVKTIGAGLTAAKTTLVAASKVAATSAVVMGAFITSTVSDVVGGKKPDLINNFKEAVTKGLSDQTDQELPDIPEVKKEE